MLRLGSSRANLVSALTAVGEVLGFGLGIA